MPVPAQFEIRGDSGRSELENSQSGTVVSFPGLGAGAKAGIISQITHGEMVQRSIAWELLVPKSFCATSYDMKKILVLFGVALSFLVSNVAGANAQMGTACTHFDGISISLEKLDLSIFPSGTGIANCVDQMQGTQLFWTFSQGDAYSFLVLTPMNAAPWYKVALKLENEALFPQDCGAYAVGARFLTKTMIAVFYHDGRVNVVDTTQPEVVVEKLPPFAGAYTCELAGSVFETSARDSIIIDRVSKTVTYLKTSVGNPRQPRSFNY